MAFVSGQLDGPCRLLVAVNARQVDCLDREKGEGVGLTKVEELFVPLEERATRWAIGALVLESSQSEPT